MIFNLNRERSTRCEVALRVRFLNKFLCYMVSGNKKAMVYLNLSFVKYAISQFVYFLQRCLKHIEILSNVLHLNLISAKLHYF